MLANPAELSRLDEYTRNTYHAANGHPDHAFAAAIDQDRTQQIQECLQRELRFRRTHDIFEITPAGDVSFKKAAYTLVMLLMAYGFIALGFGVLNWTTSGYLVSSGLLPDYIDHPWKAFFFCSLPLTFVVGLKAFATWLGDKGRRRFVLLLTTIGVIAGIIWIASFAYLFAPSATPTVMTLPGEGITTGNQVGRLLVFVHFIGEIAFAVLLGMWAEKLWVGNHKRIARLTPEFEVSDRRIREQMRELDEIEARRLARDNLSQRYEAGLQALTARAQAVFDGELKRLQAAQSSAVAQFLTAPSATP